MDFHLLMIESTNKPSLMAGRHFLGRTGTFGARYPFNHHSIHGAACPLASVGRLGHHGFCLGFKFTQANVWKAFKVRRDRVLSPVTRFARAPDQFLFHEPATRTRRGIFGSAITDLSVLEPSLETECVRRGESEGGTPSDLRSRDLILTPLRAGTWGRSCAKNT